LALYCWGYLVKDIKSGTNDQKFNVTVDNSADYTLPSPVKLVILVPSDFTDVQPVGGTGWQLGSVLVNPDGSSVVTTQTTANSFADDTAIVYQFRADAPTISETKLYVFQTTAVYPDWTAGIQIASALSEAGVEVIP